MPTYVYACKNCGHRFEKYQSFSEDSLVTCPECAQDALRKVFDSVGVVFKGSGFYRNDSRSTTSSTDAPAAKSESTSTSTKTETKTESKTESKKAAATPAASASS